MEFHATCPLVRLLLRGLLVAGDRYRGQRIPPRRARAWWALVVGNTLTYVGATAYDSDVQGMHRRTDQAAQPRHERVLELGQKSVDAHRAVANRSNAMPSRAQGLCSSHSLLLVIMRRPVRP